MRLAPSAPTGALPRTLGYFFQDKGNEEFTLLAQRKSTVQGGIPMTAQGKGAALPPYKRTEARLLTAKISHSFFLALNTLAEGFRPCGKAQLSFVRGHVDQ